MKNTYFFDNLHSWLDVFGLFAPVLPEEIGRHQIGDLISRPADLPEFSPGSASSGVGCVCSSCFLFSGTPPPAGRHSCSRLLFPRMMSSVFRRGISQLEAGLEFPAFLAALPAVAHRCPYLRHRALHSQQQETTTVSRISVPHPVACSSSRTSVPGASAGERASPVPAAVRVAYPPADQLLGFDAGNSLNPPWFVSAAEKPGRWRPEDCLRLIAAHLLGKVIRLMQEFGALSAPLTCGDWATMQAIKKIRGRRKTETIDRLHGG